MLIMIGISNLEEEMQSVQLNAQYLSSSGNEKCVKCVVAQYVSGSGDERRKGSWRALLITYLEAEIKSMRTQLHILYLEAETDTRVTVSKRK